MLLTAFFEWWYGTGWRKMSSHIQSKLHDTYREFSVPILLQTLFAPWKRIASPPGASLSDKMRTLVDNGVSRAVGVAMRSITLLAAGIIMLAQATGGGVILVLWPVLPFAGLPLVVWGLL